MRKHKSAPFRMFQQGTSRIGSSLQSSRHKPLHCNARDEWTICVQSVVHAIWMRFPLILFIFEGYSWLKCMQRTPEEQTINQCGFAQCSFWNLYNTLHVTWTHTHTHIYGLKSTCKATVKCVEIPVFPSPKRQVGWKFNSVPGKTYNNPHKTS